MQPVPKAAYCSVFRENTNVCPQRDSNLDPLAQQASVLPLDYCDLSTVPPSHTVTMRKDSRTVTKERQFHHLAGDVGTMESVAGLRVASTTELPPTGSLRCSSCTTHTHACHSIMITSSTAPRLHGTHCLPTSDARRTDKLSKHY